VQITGFELLSGMGGPFNVTAGSIEALNGEDTVMIDELYKDKLGVQGIGQTVEINGRRARVVGLTRGIRSFTTAPHVFTSFKNAQNYMGLAEDRTVYFLIRLADGRNPAAVKVALQERLKSAEVFTNEEMRRKTMFYWVFETGAGTTTLIGALLALVVGVVVVAQTIYASRTDESQT
jgi:putative ABC transport system permease protein